MYGYRWISLDILGYPWISQWGELPNENFKDAMSSMDLQECTKALTKEYRGFKDSKALAVIKQLKEARH